MQTRIEEELQNESASPETVLLEPWGMPLTLAAGAALRIVATSRQPGRLEIDRDDDVITVWAWPGATINVFQGDDLVYSSDVAVPPVPAGSSVRTFLALLGLSKSR